MQTYTQFQNVSLLLLRVFIAAIFFIAAYYKLPFWYGAIEGVSPVMTYLMMLLSVVEPLGALAVLLGLWTRLAASGLAIIMVGAVLVTQFVMNIGFTTAAGAGWNFPLMVLGGCLVLASFGPGIWAVRD